jgi:NAD(P)-dependent dehydrogenase (short-subunit alcohol dehydrogenase family)
MVWNLDGRVALITGAGSGIGAELARQLAAKGARLALIDVNGEALAAVAERLPGAQTAVADVRDAAALTAAVDDLAARCGGLDVCVANAGVATGGPLRLVGPDSFEETLDINLLGVWRTVRAALPHVLERQGYLLLVASAAAVLPAAGLGAYSTSKAGVDALGRTLRVELRAHGVGVGVAYYLFLNTPMVAAGDASPIFGATREKLPDALGKTWPLEPAVARTVRAIERRSRAVTYPPFLRGAVVLRGLLDNPLTDRVSGTGIKSMERAFAAEAERVGADAAARAVGGR